MSNARFGLRARSGLVRNIVEGSSGVDSLLSQYPGAISAISLRKLDQNYNGNCIRVRRSTDNAELDVGFVNNVLDVVSLTSFVGGGDGFVSVWYDQTVNGINGIQSSLANQIKIVNAGSVISFNGRYSGLVDGTNDDILFPTLNPYSRLDSYFIVRPTSTSYLYPYTTVGGSIFGFVAVAGNTSSGLPSGYGSPQLWVNNSLFAGTSRNDVYSFLNKHAVVVHQNASTSTFGNNYKLFGYTFFQFGGYFQELILYPSDQSSNRVGIQNNINSFYNIY